MEQKKKSKYDTNPLDPEVARRSDDALGGDARVTDSTRPAGTEDVMGATRDINRTSMGGGREDYAGEAPTRRYDNPPLPASYPSVFVPPVYEPPTARGKGSGIQSGAPFSAPRGLSSQPFNAPSSARHVANINLPENVVLLLPYIPFPFVGAVVAAVLLFLVPRSEPRARFHASQGLALHLIVLAVSFLTSLVDDFLSGPPAKILAIASAGFSVLAFIFFIVSMIRVYKGDAHVVAPLSDLTRWLDEKIEPRK